MISKGQIVTSSSDRHTLLPRCERYFNKFGSSIVSRAGTVDVIERGGLIENAALKIRPPLSATRAAVGFLAERFEEVLQPESAG